MSTILVTGANRGLGRGFVEVYLSRSNTTVIAGVRDPSHETSKALSSLPTGTGSKLTVIKLDSKSENDAAKAVKTIQAQGINHIDIVIANAGISNSYTTISQAPLEAMKEHVMVNAYAPVLLFQAVLPLLEKSKKPIFTAVGSAMGTITAMEQRPFPGAAYGSSKAMLHWFVRKIHFENEWLVAFVSDPGFAQTDMGNAGARQFGMEKAYTPTEDSVAGMVKAIDEASREKSGGHNLVWDGTEFPF